MKRAAAVFFAFLSLIFCLSSCTARKNNSPPSCREILAAMIESEVGLPAGKIYCDTAEYGSDEYLAASTVASIVGNGKLPQICESWLDCAFFLALKDHPCEFAVVHCKSRDAALDTAKLLSTRLASSKLLKGNSDYFENAKVTVIGNYALLIVSSDPTATLRAAKKVIN